MPDVYVIGGPNGAGMTSPKRPFTGYIGRAYIIWWGFTYRSRTGVVFM